MRPSNVIEYEEEHSIHDTVEISAYFQVHKRRAISERSLRTSSFFFFFASLGIKNSMAEILRQKTCNSPERGLCRNEKCARNFSVLKRRIV